MKILPRCLQTKIYLQDKTENSSGTTKPCDQYKNHQSVFCNSFKAQLFEAGLTTVEKKEIENRINNYTKNNEKISLLGKGTFGTVYKINLKNRGDVAVKILSPENKEILYNGGNLKKEAEILKNIPSCCKQTQQLVDYFRTQQREYLVSGFIKGDVLSKRQEISKGIIKNITNELFKYDTNGLLFYDLNPNNILVDVDNTGFIDFEFMEYKNQRNKNFEAFNDIHHISRNFYHPQKSNINSFENRCLGEFLQRTQNDYGNEKANNLIKTYLKSLSNYHKRMYDFLGNKNNYSSKQVSKKAIDYERTLSHIFENPSEEIIEIEKNLINLRYTTLNYHLFVHRKNEGKLIKGDIETYGDEDQYFTNMHNLAKNISEKIAEIKNNSNDSDIETYCNVNKFYIDNFLRKNANKNYFIMRKNPAVNKNLEPIAKTIVANYKELKQNKMLKSEIEKFNKEYNLIKSNNKNNKNVCEFCHDIKFVLENTLNFIEKEQI